MRKPMSSSKTLSGRHSKNAIFSTDHTKRLGLALPAMPLPCELRASLQKCRSILSHNIVRSHPMSPKTAQKHKRRKHPSSILEGYSKRGACAKRIPPVESPVADVAFAFSGVLSSKSGGPGAIVNAIDEVLRFPQGVY